MAKQIVSISPERNLLAWAVFAIIEGALCVAIVLLNHVHTAPTRRPDLTTPPLAEFEAPAGHRSAYGAWLEMGLVAIMGPRFTPNEEATAETVIQQADVVYGQGGATDLRLDLYTPIDQREKAPGILFLHLGGWNAGNRSTLHGVARHFAAMGYVTATIDYRLVKQGHFPAPVEDVKCAVRWMRANADRLKVDEDRLALVGYSAGGHLALLTAYTAGVADLEGTGGHPAMRSEVQAVVALYAPTDLSAPGLRDMTIVEGLMGMDYPSAPDQFRRASPLHQVSTEAPPTLLIHGTTDPLIPVTESDVLAARLQELGIPYAYQRLDGWPHAMDRIPAVEKYVRACIAAFLQDTVGAPPPAITPEDP